MNNLLFVYGTLKLNGRNHKFLDGKFKSVKKASTYGTLYHLHKENYPAMLKGENKVFGELYELLEFDESIKDIDLLENYDNKNTLKSEYIRSEITVYFEEGNKTVANTYIYNEKLISEENTELIPEGLWVEK